MFTLQIECATIGDAEQVVAAICATKALVRVEHLAEPISRVLTDEVVVV